MGIGFENGLCELWKEVNLVWNLFEVWLLKMDFILMILDCNLLLIW